MSIQKKDNIVGPFIGSHYPLNPYASTPFVGRIHGRLFLFPTVQHAMIAASTSAESTERMLRYAVSDPRLAKSFGRSYGINHEAVRPADLFSLLIEMYAGPILPNALLNRTVNYYGGTTRYPINSSNVVTVLQNTRNEDIVYFNYWHDNFLGVCACEKCRDRAYQGQNLYGAMLMAIRYMINLGSLELYAEEHMPKLDTELVFTAYEDTQSLEVVRGRG